MIQYQEQDASITKKETFLKAVTTTIHIIRYVVEIVIDANVAEETISKHEVGLGLTKRHGWKKTRCASNPFNLKLNY